MGDTGHGGELSLNSDGALAESLLIVRGEVSQTTRRQLVEDGHESQKCTAGDRDEDGGTVGTKCQFLDYDGVEWTILGVKLLCESHSIISYRFPVTGLWSKIKTKRPWARETSSTSYRLRRGRFHA